MRSLLPLLVFASGQSLAAQTADERPWDAANPILVLDSYEHNTIDWGRLAGDRAVKAIVHRAYFGTRLDRKVRERVAETKRRGLLAGIYLLGRPGNPVAQADLVVALAHELDVRLIALDIEDMSPNSMSLPDAQRFIERVHERTGRYPLFYTNFSTYRHISRNYGASSPFARTPLWIARFGPRHGMNGSAVWRTYALWQFQSEINCKPRQSCYRRVAGTQSDMDVNVFQGSEGDLRALFAGN